MEMLFWVSAFVVGYVYAGYPLLLTGWARMAGTPVRKRAIDSNCPWPSLSIIVAARNEAARLPARVANLLELTYAGPVEIIVVSDGSGDGTPAALAPFAGRVRLIDVPAGGKPLALNAGVAASHGEILVFADARQRFATDALVALVSNFNDPCVGCATGELMLDREPSAPSAVGEGVGLYWRYEKWLRRKESLVWSTLGATGAIYALRRDLWQPLPAETLLDDVLAPMRAVLAGRRIVFDDGALAFDRATTDAAVEARRKTRTLAGNYQILALEPRLLIPFVNPVWLQYVSHKVGRLVVPWALFGTLVASAALSGDYWVYAAAFAAQLAFYGLAAMGWWLHAREIEAAGPAAVTFTFVMMNYAAVAGLLAVRRGQRVWK